MELPEPKPKAYMDTNETTNDNSRVEDGIVAPVADAEPSGALVEVLPGLLAAYGEIDLETLDDAEVLDVDVSSVPGLSDRIAEAATGANLVAQGAQSALRARGLVRLAPETLQALRTAHPIVSDGWNLGTLASGGGRFAQSVRWLPATGAQAVTVLAGLGPAAALVAISAQASALASTAERIKGKLNKLCAELEEGNIDRLNPLFKEVCAVYNEVLQCRFDDAETRRRVRVLAEDHTLPEMYQKFLRKTRDHPTESAQNAKALVSKQKHIISDLNALIAVWRACDLVGLMSIGSLIVAGTSEGVVRQRVNELQNDLHGREEEVTASVSSLRSWAHLLLVEEENTGPFSGAIKHLEDTVKGVKPPSRKTSDRPSLRGTVKTIDDLIDSLDDARLAAPAPLAPEIRDGDADATKSLCEALRWLLPPDENLLALVKVDQGADHIVVTASRWGLVTLRKLVTTRGVDDLIPLADLRYVVDSGLKDSRRRVKIVTRERVVSVEFTRTEDGTARNSAVDRTLSLLRTAMNLPDDEREHDPLLRQSQPARAALPSATV